MEACESSENHGAFTWKIIRRWWKRRETPRKNYWAGLSWGIIGIHDGLCLTPKSRPKISNGPVVDDLWWLEYARFYFSIFLFLDDLYVIIYFWFHLTIYFHKNPTPRYWLVVWTPLKNMKVNFDDYSQYMGKKKCSKPPTRLYLQVPEGDEFCFQKWSPPDPPSRILRATIPTRLEPTTPSTTPAVVVVVKNDISPKRWRDQLLNQGF